MALQDNTRTTDGAYLERARKLGQSIERLQAGESVRTHVQINSLAEFKDLFASHLTQDQRVRHSQDLAQRHADALAAGGNVVPMARFADHIYGTGDLSEQDAQLAGQIFPVNVLVLSQADLNVTSDITYGPSASPVVLNVGTLTFNGGSITTLNTVLGISADTIAFGTTPGDKPYHIGFLGVSGAVGSAGTVGTAVNPQQAAAGSNAGPRSPGVCTGVGNGGAGSNGAVGNNGGPGATGNNGLPSLQGTLAVTSGFTPGSAQLVLFTQSGAGGQGGVGGAGGTGQQGGNGGSGCDSGCEGTDGGNAGSGGAGGNGGDGGNGGNGVNGFNITVTVPSAFVKNVVSSSAVASYGQGGFGGGGGQGGAPGSVGKGGKGSSNGSTGTQGNQGSSGKGGTPGTQQGTPGQFFVSGV